LEIGRDGLPLSDLPGIVSFRNELGICVCARSREIYRCHGLRASQQNFSCVYPTILIVRHVVSVREHVH